MRYSKYIKWILALALAGAGSVQATERGQLRALLGLPGQDLTSPLLPGFYFQANYQHYSADRFNNNAGERTIVSTPQPGVRARADTKVDADVLALRATWLSNARWGEGKLGVSATLPVVDSSVKVSPTFIGGPVLPAVAAGVRAQAAAQSGQRSGIADMEIAPFVDFQDDESRMTFALAVVAPTGEYDRDRPVNPGAGNFWTLRPIFTYSRVLDNGIELGARNTYSFNSRNRDTDYRSGQYLHSDLSALYGFNNGFKLGAGGYVVYQTTKDRGGDGTFAAPDHGNKARVYGLGPVMSWQSESGTWGVEAKVLKEFEARNRPEGTVGWVRLLMRLD
ncbi:MAG: transporter [Rhodocyclaceae bacterium]|nr:transporter [Rhodocyclaceae bacterium]